MNMECRDVQMSVQLLRVGYWNFGNRNRALVSVISVTDVSFSYFCGDYFEVINLVIELIFIALNCFELPFNSSDGRSLLGRVLT